MKYLKYTVNVLLITIKGCLWMIPGVIVSTGICYSGSNLLGAIIGAVIGLVSALWLIVYADDRHAPWFVVTPVSIAAYTYGIMLLTGCYNSIESTPTFFLDDHKLRVATGLGMICIGLFIWRAMLEASIAKDRRNGL